MVDGCEWSNRGHEQEISAKRSRYAMRLEQGEYYAVHIICALLLLRVPSKCSMCCGLCQVNVKYSSYAKYKLLFIKALYMA